MAPLLDIIFSLVIGGMLTVMMNSVMMNLRSSAGAQTANTNTQIAMTGVTAILENDIRKAGYGKGTLDSGVVSAGMNALVIRGDFDNNGTVENLSYSLGTTAIPGENPRTRILFRNVNGVSQKLKVGVSSLTFSYYDGAGTQLPASPTVTSPSRIRSVRVSLSLESTRPSTMISKGDSVYAYARWEECIRPRNLK